MKLNRLRVSNFQSFGPTITDIMLDDLTFLIGPNGAGKTVVLQALCRLFAVDPALRKVQKSDFHVPWNEPDNPHPEERDLWIEADFILPELTDDTTESSTIPPNFAHMRLDHTGGTPRVRFRLDAKLDADGDIEETLHYILNVDDNDQPLTKQLVPRPERNNIHVHYLPARRDPSDHIAYTANSLLGRALRSANWQGQQTIIKGLVDQISAALAGNSAVESIGTQLSAQWGQLHKGSFFANPQVNFAGNEIDTMLRHLSVSFSPAHGQECIDFSRLSDGQKSMLYLSLVLLMQEIGRTVLSGENTSFDVEKLKPAIFTLVAMEEPENSLSPHYLGRIVQTLRGLGRQHTAQALIATHAPSLLTRIDPETIRYLRLNDAHQTQISTVLIPPKTDEAHKFVREAVQAFPELYFSRMVVLGEGDSEEIVLPRLLNAKGLSADEAAISVVPLGGRHVNHFWRLLTALGIPFVTLLDLDLARHQGGWGRIKYVAKKLQEFALDTVEITQEMIDSIPKWDGTDKLLESEQTHHWLAFLERKGVFSSSPLDIDFAMLKAFPEAYEMSAGDLVSPDENKIKAVLGDSYKGVDQYSQDEQNLFVSYHKKFKLGSKPATHLAALSRIDDLEILINIPASFDRLINAMSSRLREIPE